MGFCFGKNTYLDNGWNKLDFFVVLTGIWTISTGTNVGVIRTIRLLRPLRAMNKVRGISDLVSSFIESIPAMLNVTFFLLFIICLFAIFGLHLFNGMFEYRCRIWEEPNLETGEWPLYDDWPYLCNADWGNCPEGSWCGAPKDWDIPWDKEEIRRIEFNYGITNYDWIFGSIFTVL